RRYHQHFQSEIMEKTIREWLDDLHEPVRTQAIVNTPMANLKKTMPSLERALICGFLWGDTPQGHGYWKEIHAKIIHDHDTDHQLGHRSDKARQGGQGQAEEVLLPGQ